MAIRFLVIWMIITAFAFLWQWIANGKQKKFFKKSLWKASISGLVAAVALTATMIFLNNLSGL